MTHKTQASSSPTALVAPDAMSQVVNIVGPFSPIGLRLSLPLMDMFGRKHRSLRISVTDRCNIRCQYCMPEVANFMASDLLLSFAEIAQFVQVVSTLGIRKVRITGGEPLMRPNLHELVGRLRALASVEEIGLTTNGMLLAEQIDSLVASGLTRVNISLDTLSSATFKRLSRRDGLERVLAGLEAAVKRPELTVRLNALVMRDINLDEVLDLVAFVRELGIALRFIEFMPLDADRAWNRSQMVSGQELRELIESQFGPLVAMDSRDASQPARDYLFQNLDKSSDKQAVIGFIDSVSQPFCGACDRLRLTADGKLRNCLFGQDEWDVKQLLRSAASAEEIERLVRACLHAKHAAHGINAQGFTPPERAMYQIGG